jgi:hypothetical protein
MKDLFEASADLVLQLDTEERYATTPIAAPRRP